MRAPSLGHQWVEIYAFKMPAPRHTTSGHALDRRTSLATPQGGRVSDCTPFIRALALNTISKGRRFRINFQILPAEINRTPPGGTAQHDTQRRRAHSHRDKAHVVDFESCPTSMPRFVARNPWLIQLSTPPHLVLTPFWPEICQICHQ